MWIESSDRESIVNMDCMDLITIEEGDGDYIIMAYESGQTTGIVLGHYATKGMAMNDLKDLCYIYAKGNGIGVYTMEQFSEG